MEKAFNIDKETIRLILFFFRMSKTKVCVTEEQQSLGFWAPTVFIIFDTG